MTPQGGALYGFYDPRWVASSILIAVLASFAAILLAERLNAARGTQWTWWLAGGSTALGIATWSMHYTGMMAFSLPVAVWYHWPTSLLAFLISLFASAVALFVVGRDRLDWRRALM